MTSLCCSRWLAAAVTVSVATVLMMTAAEPASAHEKYMTENEYAVPASEFLTDALTDPLVVVPLFAGALAAITAAMFYYRIRPFSRDVAAFKGAMTEYTEYVPWLLRISVGIPLIGAGFSGYFVSPSLEIQVRILQVAVGYLLLLGLGTRLVALFMLVLYLVGAAIWPVLLLQLELAGGLFAIMLAGSGVPSADHALQRVGNTPGTVSSQLHIVSDPIRQFQTWNATHREYLPTVTRVGLGAAFCYFGSQKLLRPGIALAMVDQYSLTAVVPASPELWVMGAGLAEAGLGFALLIGLFTRATATMAIAVFTLTLFALPNDPVLSHVTLFGMASVLLITGSGPYSADYL